MIFRRLSEAISRQNWFTVSVELAIVVLGIFLGIQASNWNEARVQDKARQEALTALKTDLALSRTNFITARERNRIIRDQLLKTLKALQSCSVNPEDQNDILASIRDYQSIQSLTIDRAAFDEMKATGQFADIEDPYIKAAILAVYFHFDLAQLFQTYMRRDLTAASRVIWDYVDLGFEPSAEREGRLEITAAIDLLQYCEERTFRNAI